MDLRDVAKSEMESVDDDSMNWGLPKAQGLYDPQNEHEACGVGFIVAIDGRRSHKVRRTAKPIVVNCCESTELVICYRSCVTRKPCPSA